MSDPSINPRPNIAVLDDYHDVSLDFFDRPGWSVTVFGDTLRPYSHPETTDAERDRLVQRLADFDVICTMRERTPFPAALIARLPKLRLLLTTGERNGSIDLAACAEHGVRVGGTEIKIGLTACPGGGPVPLPDSTTEHAAGLILALVRGIPRDDRRVRSGGGWQSGWTTRLAGRTLGVVGLGRIGTAIARVMHCGFGMRIICWSDNLTQDKADAQATLAGLDPLLPPRRSGNGDEDDDAAAAAGHGHGRRAHVFEVVSRSDLFGRADVVSIHMALSGRTAGLVGADELGRMRRSAFLVNTSRAGLVSEPALLRALEEGRIAGAGLDVFDVEPLQADSPWRTTQWGRDGRAEVVLTPHVGYVEKDVFEGWYRDQADNVARFLRGEDLEVEMGKKK